MHVEFRKCNVVKEIRALRAFDRKVFPRGDLFDVDDWRKYMSYWLIVDGKVVGCSALQHDIDFREDVREDETNLPLKGSLYIASTGILPQFQGKGFGELVKCWQIAYARSHGFNRIVTNMRSRNKKMISLNQKFKFSLIRTTTRYYSDPPDATVVMERRL